MDDLPKNGRLSKINSRDLHHLNHSLDLNKRQSLTNITHNLSTYFTSPIVPKTVQRVLYLDLGLYAYHTHKKSYFSDKY